MKPEVFLVSKDNDLIHHFESHQHSSKQGVTSLHPTSSFGNVKASSYPLLVIDSDGNWENVINTLDMKRTREGRPFYAIISGSPALKKTTAQINEIAMHLNGHSENEKKTANHNGLRKEDEHELHLSQLLEKKLCDFVRKVKHSRPHNLYNVLIKEFERPLFNLALQEMDGNQMKAAELLGVNRNTLRKKMTELKIKVKKPSKSTATKSKTA